MRETLGHIHRKMFAFPGARKLLKAQRNLHSSPQLAPWERDLVEKIRTNLHKRDKGYIEQDGSHYLSVGLSAIHCIQLAMDHSPREPSEDRILDFACGYGRVLRFLKARFPQSNISAADIDRRAIKFCCRNFAVPTFPSHREFSRIHLPKAFDIIWCGSLVTHLNQERTKDLLSFFFQTLDPGGICVFTTHGIKVHQTMAAKILTYGLAQDHIDELMAGFETSGYGYTDYEPIRHGYGVSLTSEKAIRQLAASVGSWQCIMFIPALWDAHHDVFAYYKPA